MRAKLRLLITSWMSLTVVAAAGVDARAAPAPCTGDMSHYEGRPIAKIRITSPFSFLPAAQTVLNGAAGTLLLKAGDSFHAVAYSEGAGAITGYVKARIPAGLTMVRLVVTQGAIEACDGESVEIHYTVFTALIPRTSGNIFEVATAMIRNPATTGALLGSAGRLEAVPNFNYNHTRRGFGGATIESAIPLRVFDRVTVDPLASPNSLTGTIRLQGGTFVAKKFLNRADWQVTHQYYDVPTGQSSLKKAILGVSLFGSSREMGGGATMHYGASVAGGHVQDGVHASPNSEYGELKLVGGIEGRHGQTTASASYGLQVGTTFSDDVDVFQKHVFDVRYASTFSPLPRFVRNGGVGVDDRKSFIGVTHKPLNVEAQFNAGFISRGDQIPSVERFVGGNQPDAPFIAGETWDVRDQPYIRSLPENRLGLDTGSIAVGGNRFYSANFTVSKTLFGRSLIPKDLSDQEFLDHLDGGIKSSKGIMSDTYYGKDLGVVTVAAEAGAVQTELSKVKEELTTLPGGLAADPRIKPIVKDLSHRLLVSLLTTKAITTGGKGNEIPNLIDIQLPAVAADLELLAVAMPASGSSPNAATVRTWKDSLGTAGATLKTKWRSLDVASARKKADAAAEKDFAPADSVLRTLLYRLNVYSVAPVGIFDIARVWPDEAGTRYGVGGGVRLSIVNANMTLGYAFNPSRTQQEGHGALFFKVDFTDLFR